MYLRDFFALKPFHDYSLCSVCILPRSAFYSQSAVCILHTVCILPLVRSLRFTLTVCSIQITGLQLTSQQSCKFVEKNICLFLVLVHQENFILKVFVFAPVKCRIEYRAKKSTMHKLTSESNYISLKWV